MKNRVLLAIMVLTLHVNTAKAEDNNFFRPYLGVFTGFNKIDGDNSQAEANKTGYNLGVTGTGSYFTKSFIFDGTLGWQYNQVQGSLSNVDVKVTTRSIFLDLDAKYRLSENFSAGPVLVHHFGVDNTYSELEGSSTTANLFGARLAYDTKINDSPIRFDATILKNLTNTERNNLSVNVGVSIGFDIFSKKKETPKAMPVVAKKESDYLKITLKFARVGFDTDIFALDDAAKEKLSKLGKYLRENNTQWDRLKVSGHTDVTGGKEYNQRLSQDRADAVLKVFIEAGVDEKKVQAVGYGFTQPIDEKNTPEAWEKNRRTEIEFFGVKNRVEFNKKLEEILK